jgi:hypothetical protein
MTTKRVIAGCCVTVQQWIRCQGLGLRATPGCRSVTVAFRRESWQELSLYGSTVARPNSAR